MYKKLFYILVLINLSPVLAFAQDIEEIVVTARMRSETIQSSPVSITAFGSQNIKDAGIDRMADFLQLTSNVSLAVGENPASTFLTIRGQTQVRNGESPVATVVDGVIQFSGNQFSQELLDVEKIEVVKGPQGAIYGRNATGGAILINTVQPDFEKDGYISLSYGRGDEYAIEGAFGGAIIADKLAGRISAKFMDRDGYFTNITLNKKDDPYKNITVRGQLKWLVSDNLTTNLSVDISRTDSRGVGFVYQPAIFGSDGITAASIDFAAFIPDLNDVPRAINDANRAGDIPFTANNEDRAERDIEQVSLRLNYDMDFATLTSITSYTNMEISAGADQFPYTAARNLLGLADGTQTQYVSTDAWSQEVRLTSSSENRLRWLAGAYYLTWDRFISTTVGQDTGTGIFNVERTPVTAALNPTLTFFGDDNDNQDWAVFGQLNYDLTEQIELSAALRYDEETRKQQVSPFNTGGTPGVTNEKTFSKWQPKLTARYTPSDDLTFYATWGIGFRSGQFNQNGTGAAAAVFGISGLQDVADQEDTESYELGVKSDWFGDRLRFNSSVYMTDVEGQHYYFFVGAIGSQVLNNIDEVSLWGVEIDAIFRATDYLDIYAAYGLTDSEIDVYSTDPSVVGNWTPYVPRSTINMGAQVRYPLAATNLNLFARVDYERRGKQFWDPQNSTIRSALDLVNLRFGIEDRDGRWSVLVSANNLTDELYNSDFVPVGFAHRADPRTWDVAFRYEFF